MPMRYVMVQRPRYWWGLLEIDTVKLIESTEFFSKSDSVLEEQFVSASYHWYAIDSNKTLFFGETKTGVCSSKLLWIPLGH